LSQAPPSRQAALVTWISFAQKLRAFRCLTAIIAASKGDRCLLVAHCAGLDVRRNRLLGSQQPTSIRRHWIGVRAQAGRLAPKDFPRSNSFGPAF